jgi:hypothetical protein
MMFFFALVLLLMPSLVKAACSGSSPTLTAASAAQTDVADCVTAAVSGDTIHVPSGAVTWSSNLTITNKDIAIIGAGIGNTVVTVGSSNLFIVNMTSAGAHPWRISGFTFTGSPDTIINLTSTNVNGTTSGWRIDHIRFHVTGEAGSNKVGVQATGITWGLMDHLTVDAAGFVFNLLLIAGYLSDTAVEDGDCTPHCLGFTYWNRAVNLGSAEAIYIEDSTITGDGSSMTFAVQDMEYGGSVVVRHNTITGGYVQTHSSRSNALGGMKYEVYNNTFIGEGFNNPFLLRSGTGVVFNNTISGYTGNDIYIDGQREVSACQVNVAPLGQCNGANSYDGNSEASGWPCIGQVGRGAVSSWDENGGTQANTPLYGWKNGSTATCASGGVCNNSSTIALNGACTGISNYLKTTGSEHTGGVVDYVNNGDTPKPDYVAFTYPHPLQITGASALSGSISITGGVTIQ